jgi:23S rRNA pseudouridine1911/1915/1917 synthase
VTTAFHDPSDEAAEAAARMAALPAVTVLFEDDNLLAVEKPAGLVTHPTYKHPNGTLTDLIFARQTARGEGRPWLLHRLDRETSGIVLFAKTEAARRGVVRQFERRTVRKQYLAVTLGIPPTQQAVIEAPLARDPADRRRTIIVEHGGQPAATCYAVLATTNAATGVAPLHSGALVLVEPITGRTHQIRAHLAHIGAPLAGDSRYLPAEATVAGAIAPRALLHAWRLTITAPQRGEPLTITAPVPADLRAAALALGLDLDLAVLSAGNVRPLSAHLALPADSTIALIPDTPACGQLPDTPTPA